VNGIRTPFFRTPPLSPSSIPGVDALRMALHRRRTGADVELASTRS